MKKLGIYVLEALVVVLLICAFAASDRLFKGFIDFNTFVARIGLFGALTGVCVHGIGRFDDEEE